MAAVVPGVALGLLLWFGFVLGIVENAAKPWFVVTVPPYCTSEDPLVRVGLFEADISSDCLQRQDVSDDDDGAEPARRTYFDGIEPQTVDSTMLFLSSDAWTLSRGALLGRVFKLEGASASECVAFWTGEMAEVMSYEPLASDAVVNVESSIRERSSDFETQLLAELAAFQEGMIRILWLHALHESESLLRAYVESFDSATGAEYTPTANETNSLVYLAARGAALADLDADAACGNRTDSSEQDAACREAVLGAQTLITRLYLGVFVEAMYSTNGIDSQATDAASQLAADIGDMGFDMRYNEVLSAIDVAIVLTTGPLEITLNNDALDHPLCLAYRAVGALSTNVRAEDPCPLAAVVFSTQDDYSNVFDDFISAQIKFVISIFDGSHSGDAQDWCDNPSWWIIKDDRRRLQVAPARSGRASFVSDLEDLLDLSLVVLRHFLSTMCEAKTFIESHELAEWFLLAENCARGTSSDACVASFTGVDALAGSSVLPTRIDTEYALCRRLTADGLAALFPDDIYGTESPDSGSESTALMVWRNHTLKLQQQCSFAGYLSSGDLGSIGEVALTTVIEPCEEIGTLVLRDCLGLRSALDIAAVFYGTKVDALEDLSTPCATAPARGAEPDLAFGASTYLIPVACSLSAVACIPLLIAILRRKRTGICVASLFGAVAALAQALGLLFMSMSGLHKAEKSHLFAETEVSSTGTSSGDAGNGTQIAAQSGNSSVKVGDSDSEDCVDGELCVGSGAVHLLAFASLLMTLLATIMLMCAFCCLKRDRHPREDNAQRSKELHSRFAYAAHAGFMRDDADEHSILNRRDSGRSSASSSTGSRSLEVRVDAARGGDDSSFGSRESSAVDTREPSGSSAENCDTSPDIREDPRAETELAAISFRFSSSSSARDAARSSSSRASPPQTSPSAAASAVTIL